MERAGSLVTVETAGSNTLGKLLAEVCSEFKCRARAKLLNHWICEKVHLFILQREGEKTVTKKIHKIIIAALKTVDREFLLKHPGAVRFKVKLNERYSLFIYKDSNSESPLLTAEFTGDLDDKKITYQIHIQHCEGVLQDIVGVSKFNSSYPFPITTFNSSLQSKKTLKYLSELLRQDLSLRNSEIVISSPTKSHIRKVRPKKSNEPQDPFRTSTFTCL